MTEIDTSADIDIVWSEHEVTVRIPLAGEVPAEWSRRYDQMARREGLVAQSQAHPSRAWIVVTMPAAVGRSDLAATMDSARDLIAKADTAAEEAADPEETTALLRQWWADQRA